MMNINRNIMQNIHRICIGTALAGGVLTLTSLANSKDKTQDTKKSTELTTKTTKNPLTETPELPVTATALGIDYVYVRESNGDIVYDGYVCKGKFVDRKDGELPRSIDKDIYQLLFLSRPFSYKTR